MRKQKAFCAYQTYPPVNVSFNKLLIDWTRFNKSSWNKIFVKSMKLWEWKDRRVHEISISIGKSDYYFTLRRKKFGDTPQRVTAKILPRQFCARARYTWTNFEFHNLKNSLWFQPARWSRLKRNDRRFRLRTPCEKARRIRATFIMPVKGDFPMAAVVRSFRGWYHSRSRESVGS